KRAYCLKTQPATGETYPKSDLFNKAVEGWTSVMIAIFFLGGVQMLSLGIIGEYVGKIYIETKNRPKYFIDESVGNDSNGK
ncbi:hypothetical protein CI621_24665, partial [Klebsiella pneumoniae subsp. pneumoniae]